MSENWNKSYNRINWKNYPSEDTPINETNLNLMDSSLNVVDNRVLTLDTIKLDLDTANTMVKDVTLNSSTGVITITFLNGTTRTYDTKLEKLAVNFTYDSQNQRLVITLDDGTKQYVDLSSLITEYEFTDTDTIDFSVSSGSVSAIVKDGSITESKLQPNYLADIQTIGQQASADAATASISATKAHQWATYGSDSEQPSATNNSKYWAQQSQQSFQKTDVYRVMGYNGAKNLLTYPYVSTSFTRHGITWTDNGDGRVKINGTSENTTAFVLLGNINDNRFAGMLMTGGISSYVHVRARIGDKTTDAFISQSIDSGNGVVIPTINPETEHIRFEIVISSNQTVNNITLYPMIRRNEDTDATWQPYAMTNKQLTDNKVNNDNIAPIENGTTASQTLNASSYIMRKGQLYKVTTTIAQDSAITEGVNIESATVGGEISTINNNNTWTSLTLEGDSTTGINVNSAHKFIKVNKENIYADIIFTILPNGITSVAIPGLTDTYGFILGTINATSMSTYFSSMASDTPYTIGRAIPGANAAISANEGLVSPGGATTTIPINIIKHNNIGYVFISLAALTSTARNLYSKIPTISGELIRYANTSNNITWYNMYGTIPRIGF